MQVKCWQIRKGSKAPQAAGAIHGDFERYPLPRLIRRVNPFGIMSQQHIHSNPCQQMRRCLWVLVRTMSRFNLVSALVRSDLQCWAPRCCMRTHTT